MMSENAALGRLSGIREAIQIIKENCSDPDAGYSEDGDLRQDAYDSCVSALECHLGREERRMAAEAAGETRWRCLTFTNPWPGHPKGAYVLQYIENDVLLSSDVCYTPLEIGRTRSSREATLKNHDLYEDVSGRIKVIGGLPAWQEKMEVL